MLRGMSGESPGNSNLKDISKVLLILRNSVNISTARAPSATSYSYHAVRGIMDDIKFKKDSEQLGERAPPCNLRVRDHSREY